MEFILTVITICRNAKKMLEMTSESLICQKSINFQWIVIDGNSVDGTQNIIPKYKRKCDLFISEPDDGIYDAMNKGLRYAKGEYVLFLNAGDTLYNSKTLSYINFSINKDLIVGDLYFRQKREHNKSPEKLQENFLLSKMLPHQATFFRRDIFDKYGYFDSSYRIAGDYEMFSRLIQKYKVSYAHVPDIIANFDETGISSDDNFRYLRKQENHRVRWKYFPRYRYSLKSIRQVLRNFTN
jgi:glycosyltransferase involved in cell wall biosynthesis